MGQVCRETWQNMAKYVTCDSTLASAIRNGWHLNLRLSSDLITAMAPDTSLVLVVWQTMSDSVRVSNTMRAFPDISISADRIAFIKVTFGGNLPIFSGNIYY